MPTAFPFVHLRVNGGRILGKFNLSLPFRMAQFPASFTLGKLMQNLSHAVMSQRIESRDSADDFPTPPWATRALFEHVINGKFSKHHSALEPACGRGYMSNVITEYVGSVESRDKFDYGFGQKSDFLNNEETKNFDWIITNPPFKDAESFILKSLDICNVGCAFLVRTVFLESVGRYNRLFSKFPPSAFAQFVERVPMVKGRLDSKASTATGYAWLVWHKTADSATNVVWIPPCRRALERRFDYPTLDNALLLI